jgi:hypothetical protein
MMRFVLGFGYAECSAEQGGITNTYSGTAPSAGSFEFSIGGVVAPNLALHAALWDWVITSPELKVSGGDNDGTAKGDEDTQFGMVAYGAGVTYFIMPFNSYVSALVGAGQLSLNNGYEEQRTDTGLAFRAVFGKEWWVSDNWGLGAAASVDYSSIPGAGEDPPTWQGIAGNVGFTATFN